MAESKCVRASIELCLRKECVDSSDDVCVAVIAGSSLHHQTYLGGFIPAMGCRVASQQNEKLRHCLLCSMITFSMFRKCKGVPLPRKEMKPKLIKENGGMDSVTWNYRAVFRIVCLGDLLVKTPVLLARSSNCSL